MPSLEELGSLLTCAADLSYCTICACYQTQHKVRSPFFGLRWLAGRTRFAA